MNEQFPRVPLKRLAHIEMGQSPPSKLCNVDGEGMPFLQGNAEFGDEHPTPKQFCISPPKRCEGNDLLMSVRAPVGARNIADQAYGIGRGLCAIRPYAVHPRFLWYATDVVVRDLQATAVGSTYGAVTAEDVGFALTPAPPIDTQRGIADFLDRETARIDGLIEKRQRLVALVTSRLDATAAAILVEAGKRSSDHNAQLPGELASAWPVLTLRQAGVTVCTGPFGTQFSADEYVSGGIPMINPTHIKNGRVQPDPEATVSPLTAKRLDRHRAAIGDVVLGRKGDVGRSALITAHEEGWLVGSDSIAIRTARSSLRPEYLSALLQLTVIRQQLEAHSTGATLANVNESILLNLRVPVPPLRRQDKLYERYARVASSHASLRQKVELQIGLLREHRQALVTAAVMGQINVRACNPSSLNSSVCQRPAWATPTETRRGVCRPS